MEPEEKIEMEAADALLQIAQPCEKAVPPPLIDEMVRAVFEERTARNAARKLASKYAEAKARLDERNKDVEVFETIMAKTDDPDIREGLAKAVEKARINRDAAEADAYAVATEVKAQGLADRLKAAVERSDAAVNAVRNAADIVSRYLEQIRDR